MKPGNPPAYKRGKGANSGGIFREMRGMSHKANPLNHRGFFVERIAKCREAVAIHVTSVLF